MDRSELHSHRDGLTDGNELDGWMSTLFKKKKNENYLWLYIYWLPTIT